MNEEVLRAWCLEQLGSSPVAEIFRASHLSVVVGLKLADGREVVVKVRPLQHRLFGCFEVQRHLFDSGFPCPEPLLNPTPLGSWCASAERLVAGGYASPPSARDPMPFASPLAQVIRIATPLAAQVDLEPKPSWNRWDHAERGIWPVAEDSERPLNEVVGPAWLDRAGSVARECLATGAGPVVIGHGDWYSENLRFHDHGLLVAMTGTASSPIANPSSLVSLLPTTSLPTWRSLLHSSPPTRKRRIEILPQPRFGSAGERACG